MLSAENVGNLNDQELHVSLYVHLSFKELFQFKEYK